MTGPRATARRTPRVRVRTATTAAFVVLAAMVPAALATADTQQVDTALTYLCAFPSGQRQATVRVSAAVPDRVEPRQAIRPADVTTTVELPAEAVADLKAPQAAEVRAATRLTVGVAQNDATAEATWRGTAQPVAVPGPGPLTLTATGDVPSVTARSAGDLTLSARSLAIDLAVSPTDGTGATPAPLTVECALDQDAPGHGLLATVAVGSRSPEPSGSPSGSGTPSPSPTGGPSQRPADPRPEQAPKVAESTPDSAPDRDAPPCRYDAQHPATAMSLNAYITGYSNVTKQNGAALIPLSCTLVEQGETGFEMTPDGSAALITQHSEGQLSYQGGRRTPPFKATFLTFGFTPTTATMVLEQTGPLTLDALGRMDMTTFFTGTDTYIRVPLVLRVTDLEVNGTRLDVGPDCRTRTSLSSPDPEPKKHPGDHLVLHGRGEQALGEPATGYLLTSGGPLTGEATIPAFTGCGTGGEDLDPLLTASVSGPGNYVKQIQGQTCSQAQPNPDECTADLQPLKIPVPER
ncbi:DUF6801 domain-containing protein [Streptomyces sp. NPDC015220]|uniref:DUF6801 domain-containing protein n=1 Tax=Streptomyces sp. NPDC015220 TaxID=3364947 RepID=UPI0037005DFF